MTKKHRPLRKGTHRGRPRKEGERQPSGRLKPPAPNSTVVAARRAMLGAEPTERVDISKAENSLDLALARGWMTEEDHRAARAYAALHRRAGLGLPRMKTANLQEGEGEHSREARRAGVVETSIGIRPVHDLDGDAGAHDTLKLMWSRMTSEERTELLNLAVLESWPQWIIRRAYGSELTDHWEGKRRALLQALIVVRHILDLRSKRGHHRGYDKVEAA